MNCAQKTKCSLTEVVRNSECIVKNPKFILVRLAGLVYRGACRRMAARHRCGDHGEDDDRALEADAEAAGQLRDDTSLTHGEHGLCDGRRGPHSS